MAAPFLHLSHAVALFGSPSPRPVAGRKGDKLSLSPPPKRTPFARPIVPRTPRSGRGVSARPSSLAIAA
ncbi:hypothetical protein LX32DRAFT_641375 [Colletotrichum zoysiae]|uniref:Uncharacterized protein n=1 Tax=Colletotrichum zoysiae TaxID=1216348 RepID=A0AAD9HDB3_9PEZI|nr:hypothetical protein LX32DRAFT_641375 [Colletotrichum zoysiae]